MTGIEGYSSTAAANTELAPENCAPSVINNAIRAVQADLAVHLRASEWIEYGDGNGSGDGTASYTAAYLSGTSLQITGADVTGAYHAGRRIKATGTSTTTIYGTISDSSLSGSDTVVNVTWDTGSLANDSDLRIWIGAVSATNTSLPAAALAGQTADLDSAVLSRGVMKSERWSVGTATLSGAATDTDATLTLDCATGNYFAVTLDRGVTTVTFSNVPASGVLYDFLLDLTWDATGGWDFSGYPAGMKFAGGSPTWTTTGGTAGSITGYTADGGTSWRAGTITGYS